MFSLIPVVLITSAILLLFSLLRIAESAFIRIPSDFIDTIDNPSPSDYRTDQYLDKPAPVLVAFSIMKYIAVSLLIAGLLFLCRLLFHDLPFFQKTLIALASFWLFLWVFGEIIPSLFRKYDPVKTFQVSFVLVIPFAGATQFFRDLFPVSFARHESRISRKDMISMSDISDAIENAEVEDEEVMEKQLIRGVINFGDLEVKEIMRARIDVVSFSCEETFSQVLDKMLDAGYSRYPVYGSGLDDIKGIVYLKDLLPAMRRGDINYAWSTNLRQALFVPENMKISQLMVDFQARKMHMAVVVDEYGGTSGIVSLEDILEEIVGEINDEHDADSDLTLARKIGDNQYVFDAKIPLHDFIRFTELDNDFFDEFEGGVETLGGVILSVNGNFPVKNQKIMYKNLEITVLSMAKHRIGNVKISIHDETNPAV